MFDKKFVQKRNTRGRDINEYHYFMIVYFLLQ